ncbi:hypothetical protein GCM10023185_14270 [Hymenobacter saemangeumensis]|uniref:Uncharacterized protein n=1 Tax=Hymenobacter saemangeumensis TaxID=1084522 RepID=A0ABP8I8B5_9BACT
MLRLSTYGLLLLLWSTVSCAPTYYLGMKPAHPTNLFIEGREQAQNFADSVEVRLSFVRYEPTRLVFEAEYRNPSKRPLVVAPTDFGCQPSRRALEARPANAPRVKPARGTAVSASVAAASRSEYLQPLPAKVPAIDPEAEISALQRQADKEAARASRIDWLGVALTATSLVADISSIGKRETVSQFQSRALLHETAMAYNIASGANKVRQAITAEELRRQSGRLQEHALRKVTLQPGEQVYGLVYFPRIDTADTLRLQAPGPNGPVPLEFIQTHTRE